AHSTGASRRALRSRTPPAVAHHHPAGTRRALRPARRACRRGAAERHTCLPRRPCARDRRCRRPVRRSLITDGPCRSKAPAPDDPPRPEGSNARAELCMEERPLLPQFRNVPVPDGSGRPLADDSMRAVRWWLYGVATLVFALIVV